MLFRSQLIIYLQFFNAFWSQFRISSKLWKVWNYVCIVLMKQICLYSFWIIHLLFSKHILSFNIFFRFLTSTVTQIKRFDFVCFLFVDCICKNFFNLFSFILFFFQCLNSHAWKTKNSWQMSFCCIFLRIILQLKTIM